MATVNDKFRVKNGLRVDNELKENIFEVNDTVIESQRTIEANSVSASSVPLIINSKPSQTADLQQWKNSDGDVIAKIDKDGKATIEGLETISHVVIGGNLTVNGTTTTIHSTNATIEDPIIILGGENPPEFFDPKWRGVEFRWYDTEAHTGFFGFDSTTQRFTYIPDALNDGEIFSGDLGSVEFNNGYFSGNLEVNGGSISSQEPYFQILNANVESIDIGGQATEINIGLFGVGKTNINHNLDVNGDLNVLGDSLDSIVFTFNLLNYPKAINFGELATVINIGASTGTTSIKNNLDVDGDINLDGGDLTSSSSTFNLLHTPATINIGAAATDVQIGSSTGTTNVNNDLDVDGNMNIDGGDLTVSSTTFNLANSTATTVNFAGAATDVQIGAATGTTNVNNNLDVDGDVNIDGGDLTTSVATFNLLHTPTTINFGAAATDVQIGSSTGTTNINNNLDVDGDISVDGGDFVVSTSTFNLANTNATTVNFAGAATDIQIGSASGTTNVNNDLDVDGNANVDGGTISTNQTNFNLLKSNVQYLDFALDAIDLKMGSTTGTTTVRNNLDVEADLTVKGEDIKVTTALVNIANDTATTVNFSGAATVLNIGADTGTTTINNNLTVKDILTIEGATTNFNPPTAGTAPFTVGANAFDVLVAGLNADKLDGQTGTWYQARENHTGTQLNTTISNWREAVEDTVSPMFVHSQQSGIVAQYNDETGRILLTVAGGGGTGEAVDFGLLYWMGV